MRASAAHAYHNLHPLRRRTPCQPPRVLGSLRPRQAEPYRPRWLATVEALLAIDAHFEREFKRLIRAANQRIAEGDMSFRPFDQDQDNAEIRMIRAIGELNHRILLTPDPTQRTQLRLTVAALRAEVVKLIESMPIHSEADVESFRASHHGMALQVATPRFT